MSFLDKFNPDYDLRPEPTELEKEAYEASIDYAAEELLLLESMKKKEKS